MITSVDAASSRRRPRQGSLWLLPAALPLVGFFVLPLIAICWQVPGRDLLSHLQAQATLEALRLSLGTATVSTGLAVLLGTPLALAIARGTLPGRRLIDTLIDLPMVLPPSVAGIALLLTFGRNGLIGTELAAAGMPVAFTTAAVVLAQLFVSAPYYVRAATAGLARVETELEQAAAVDGAGPAQIWWRITVPLAWPALFAGMVACWARALGEFGATLMFAGNLPGVTQTMPLAVYVGFEVELSQALALAMILVAISFATLLVLRSLDDAGRRGA